MLPNATPLAAPTPGKLHLASTTTDSPAAVGRRPPKAPRQQVTHASKQDCTCTLPRVRLTTAGGGAARLGVAGRALTARAAANSLWTVLWQSWAANNLHTAWAGLYSTLQGHECRLWGCAELGIPPEQACTGAQLLHLLQGQPTTRVSESTGI